MTSAYVLSQVVNGLILGSMYALIAIGFSMIYGIVQLINFAHGDIFAIGAFVTLACIAGLNLPFPLTVSGRPADRRGHRHGDRAAGVPADARRAAGDGVHRLARRRHHPRERRRHHDHGPAAHLPGAGGAQYPRAVRRRCRGARDRHRDRRACRSR